MSILEPESAAHVMTESLAHVLGGRALKAWGYSGETFEYPYNGFAISRNQFSGNSDGYQNGPAPYLDGTWMAIYFPVAPTRLGQSGNTWVALNPVAFLGNSIADIHPVIAKTLFAFGDAWKMITPQEFDPTNLVVNPGDGGVFFVAKLGDADGGDAKNAYTVTFQQGFNPGRYLMDSGYDFYAETYIVGSGGNFILESLVGAQIQAEQPKAQLVAADNGQVVDIPTVDPGQISETLDTAVLFGRAARFFPRVSFPNRTISLVPQPYSQYDSPPYDASYVGYQGLTRMGVYFIGGLA